MTDSERHESVYGAASGFIEHHRARVVSAERRAREIRELVTAHDRWRRSCCLNLTPAENTLSRRASALLDSDLATRVTEGLPGDKEYPAGIQNQYIDAIEATLIAEVAALFDAPFVEWRPVSTTMANAVVFFALAERGERLLVQSREAGGNYSYQQGAIPGLAGLQVHPIPARGDLFDLDVSACRSLAHELRPRLIVIGGSYALFPSPVAELAEIAHEIGALLVVDMAHTALFAATGHWPNPLDQGADVITLSTHKVMGGPVGGMVLTRDPAIARRIVGLTFPAFMQTRDQNKYAAAAHAMCEMRAFGQQYAQAMLDNSMALGTALQACGFKPLHDARGYSMSHLLVVDLKPFDARDVCRRWQAANILLSAEHLARDVPGHPTGVRLTVQEVTRRGMGVEAMKQIARWMAAIAIDRVEPQALAAEIERFVAAHSRLHYSFDE
jgi:glycine hydroxymethyltransferase